VAQKEPFIGIYEIRFYAEFGRMIFLRTEKLEKIDLQEFVRLIKDGSLDVTNDVAVLANDLGKRHLTDLLELSFTKSGFVNESLVKNM